MFIGHIGVAMGAKVAAPRIPLGTLVIAAQFVDLLWPVLLLAGIEHARVVPGIMAASSLEFTDYPISHSLLTVLGWGALVGGLYWILRRRIMSTAYRADAHDPVGGLYWVLRREARGAWVLGAVVVSHWVLDLLVHQPDLPLFPGGPRLGLGMWNSLPASMALELGILILGTVLYLRATRARDAVGRVALWAFVLILAVIYLSSLFGPPPPDARTVAQTGLAGWLLVLWGYWIDRHRKAGGGES